MPSHFLLKLTSSNMNAVFEAVRQTLEKIWTLYCSLRKTRYNMFVNDRIVGRPRLPFLVVKCKLICFFALLSVASCNLKIYTVVQTRSHPYQTWQRRFSSTQTSGRPNHTLHSWPHHRNINRQSNTVILDEPTVRKRTSSGSPYFALQSGNFRQPHLHSYEHTLNKTPSTVDHSVMSIHKNRIRPPLWNERRQFNSFPPWYADKYRRYPRDPPDESWHSASGNSIPWNYQSKCRSCGRVLLQDSYCSDDFVLRIYAHHEVPDGDHERLLVVYVFDVFKDIRQSLFANRYIRIAYHCDRFGMGPMIGETYVITGLYTNNVPSVDSCSWKALWSHMTRQQKRYLRIKYQQYCDVCKIERVLRYDVHRHNSADTCYVALTPNPNEIACRDRFSLCRYQHDLKACAFNHRPHYDVCEKWFSYKS